MLIKLLYRRTPHECLILVQIWVMSLLGFDGEGEFELKWGVDLEFELPGSLELTFNELDESELEEVELQELKLDLELELNAEGGSHAGHPAAHTHRTASVCALPRERAPL